MAAYVCKVCGAAVWAEAGREIRTSIQHGKDAGHPDNGLCLPDSARARQLRGYHPTRQSSHSRARRRYDALPLNVRVVIWLMAASLGLMAGSALADTLDDTPPAPFKSCSERIACGP
jgi:hypothetical protein